VTNLWKRCPECEKKAQLPTPKSEQALLRERHDEMLMWASKIHRLNGPADILVLMRKWYLGGIRDSRS
jgi:hypothetical protein